jgi:hypothetical protein
MKFIEIKTIHGKNVLINIEQIEVIAEGISVDHNFIELKNGGVHKTHETIEEIKTKLK